MPLHYFMQQLRARLFLKGRTMQNREKLKPVLLALGLALSAMSVPLGTVYAQAIVSSETGDGSVELSNTSGTGDQVLVPPESGIAEAGAAVDSAEAKPPKDPREAYRDLVMQVPEDVQGATSAVSRRYKKVDKATYNDLLQSGALQPAQ
jgi:hypothetical protein